jgi:hypothetical protein
MHIRTGNSYMVHACIMPLLFQACQTDVPWHANQHNRATVQLHTCIAALQMTWQHCVASDCCPMQELGRLDEDSTVYKQIGPAMIKQDLVEAQTNVSKRLEFIQVRLPPKQQTLPLCTTK